MPAIAPIEDLRNAQKELLEARDLNELKGMFRKWHRFRTISTCVKIQKSLYESNWLDTMPFCS